MRGINIAREIRRLGPSSQILFYTKNSSAEMICGEEFRLFIETDAEGLSHWPGVVRSFSPDVIIYDTLLPGDAREETGERAGHSVYIMRKSKEEKQREIFQNPFLNAVGLILIPHTPAEFACEVPPSFRPKTFFVGPIVRMPRPETQEVLKNKYQIGPNDFLLTSTAGGGGFEEAADSFFATVLDIHRRLYPILPNLRHLTVLGPHFGKSLLPPEGMTVIDYEPEMIDLFAISNLVIAEGGYNTVNEIRLAKTPAVFLPSGRKFDDQEERVRTLEKMGLAFVFSERSRAVSQKIVEICLSETSIDRIRKSYAADRMELGNRKAAEMILEWASK